MNAAELIKILSSFEQNTEIVTGEEWLPEQLIAAEFDGELINLKFDNAPDEGSGDNEARGFVEHEIEMLKDKIVQLLFDNDISAKVKTDMFLKLFLMVHENSSTDVIEILESTRYFKEKSLVS